MCRWLLFYILPHLTFCFWHTEFRFKFFGKIHLLDCCIFVFTSFDTVWHTVLVSVPPPPPTPTNLFIRCSFLVKIHLLESRELTVRVVGLPPLPPPPRPLPEFFLSDLVLAPSSLHQPPPDKGHTVREYY